MAKKAAAAPELRRCVGSKTFGIEPHDEPIGNFPVQPSRKDGLGVMCTPHWKEYVKALRERAKARDAEQAQAADSLLDDAAARDAAETYEAVTENIVREAEAKPKHANVVDATEAQKQEIADLEKQLASAGGVGTDQGQAILEAAANRSAAMRVGRRDGADLDPQAVEA